MRRQEIVHDAHGRCTRISYLGPRDCLVGNFEHLTIAQFAGRKKISIRSLGGEFTYDQVETIAKAMLSMAGRYDK